MPFTHISYIAVEPNRNESNNFGNPIRTKARNKKSQKGSLAAESRREKEPSIHDPHPAQSDREAKAVFKGSEPGRRAVNGVTRIVGAMSMGFTGDFFDEFHAVSGEPGT